MNQYCRYCAFCHDFGCTDVFWCDDKEKELPIEMIKRTNHCKSFGFCNIDIITQKEYKPRGKYKAREKLPDKQMRITWENMNE